MHARAHSGVSVFVQSYYNSHVHMQNGPETGNAESGHGNTAPAGFPRPKGSRSLREGSLQRAPRAGLSCLSCPGRPSGSRGLWSVSAWSPPLSVAPATANPKDRAFPFCVPKVSPRQGVEPEERGREAVGCRPLQRGMLRSLGIHQPCPRPGTPQTQHAERPAASEGAEASWASRAALPQEHPTF